MDSEDKSEQQNNHIESRFIYETLYEAVFAKDCKKKKNFDCQLTLISEYKSNKYKVCLNYNHDHGDSTYRTLLLQTTPLQNNLELHVW